MESEPLTNDSPTSEDEGNDAEDSPQEEDTEQDSRKTLRERIDGARQKVTKARGKTKEAVARTAPARKKISDAREAVDPRNITSRRWGFLWAVVASWVLGPQFFVACWDRLTAFFGQHQMMSGPDAMAFDLGHGPGRWFRDVVGRHWENGQMAHLVVCAAFGIVPLLLIACANTWKKYSRWFIGVAILGPAVYVTGVSYAGWSLTWEDIYLVTLFGSTWYCTVWVIEKKEPSFTRFLLMIPLASVVSGILLYSPGAVW